jgi:DNA polymerase (family 10)
VAEKPEKPEKRARAEGAPLENVEIAQALREVADLLDIQGANPFRVRAYRNAARTVDNLTSSLAEMVEADADLTELPTIGTDLAAYITELVETGRLSVLREVRQTVPAGLTQLLRLNGIGPRRAARLHEELGVESVADLERALEAGEVERLRGFGERSAARMRQAIVDYKKHTARYRLAEADQLVRPLLEYMRRAPGLEEIEVAGSYRRRQETIGDIDLLAVGEAAAPVMAHFTSYPSTVRVEMAGPTRGTITLRSGLQVDLRILPRRSYGAALHYFTGSKTHNIAVRKLGIERGLRISEYGIFQVRGGKEAAQGTAKRGGGGKAGTAASAGRGGGKEAGRRIGGAREEEVFKAVGMEWVPPELREDRGEVEAARKGKLPHLVDLDDIRGDLQMHTNWSDGKNTIEEMARAGQELGYAYLAITDHSRAVRVARGLDPARLEEQWREFDQVRERVRGIQLLRGMEVDILHDGTLDLPDEYLERLDLVLAAVHTRMGLGRAKMTERIIKGITHPAVHILAHPTGRIINQREGYQVDIEAVLAAAAELGVAVELNAQPDRLDLNDLQVRRAQELGVKVAINTDAHSVETLRFMSYGIDQARRGWLEKGDVVNCMTWAGLKRWLGRRR